jgi:hypothetical protein
MKLMTIGSLFWIVIIKINIVYEKGSNSGTGVHPKSGI